MSVLHETLDPILLPRAFSLKLLRWLASTPAMLRGLLLLLLVASAAALGAARHDGTTLSVRAPGESQPALSAGAPKHGAKALGQRAEPPLVAATPLLERAPAHPALPTTFGAARSKARALESRSPLSPVYVAVVRWRRHTPRMDSGDPPRSTPFAA